MDLHEGNTKAYRSWGSGVTDGIQDCRAGVQDGREWQERRARYKWAKKAHKGVRGERGGEERGGEKGERGGWERGGEERDGGREEERGASR